MTVLCAAALIINVDNTILNVALPTLVRELHATSVPRCSSSGPRLSARQR